MKIQPVCKNACAFSIYASGNKKSKPKNPQETPKYTLDCKLDEYKDTNNKKMIRLSLEKESFLAMLNSIITNYTGASKKDDNAPEKSKETDIKLEINVNEGFSIEDKKANLSLEQLERMYED